MSLLHNIRPAAVSMRNSDVSIGSSTEVYGFRVGFQKTKNPRRARVFGLLWMMLDKDLVGNVRFELTAFGFGGQRSIQLS